MAFHEYSPKEQPNFGDEKFAYVESDFQIKVSFNWKTSINKVFKIEYTIENEDPKTHKYKLDNVTICCDRIPGVRNVYFLMFNFIEVEFAREATLYKKDSFEPQCILDMSKGSVLFIKRNTYDPTVENPNESCTNIEIFDDNPDSKDGSIIIGTN